jgi:hypothetical protein
MPTLAISFHPPHFSLSSDRGTSKAHNPDHWHRCHYGSRLHPFVSPVRAVSKSAPSPARRFHSDACARRLRQDERTGRGHVVPKGLSPIHSEERHKHIWLPYQGAQDLRCAPICPGSTRLLVAANGSGRKVGLTVCHVATIFPVFPTATVPNANSGIAITKSVWVDFLVQPTLDPMTNSPDRRHRP